jgi:cysteine-rich repeat protein
MAFVKGERRRAAFTCLLCLTSMLIGSCGDDDGGRRETDAGGRDAGKPTRDAAVAPRDSGSTDKMDSGSDATAPLALGQISGRVTDLNGAPLEGVMVKLADHSAVSGQDGSFMLGLVPVGMQQSLTAEQAGFSKGLLRVDVFAQAEQSLSIKLMATESKMITDPSAGGMVETPSGVKLDLPADAFVGADGRPVTGPIKLEIALLNDRDEMAAAPGGMIALSPDGSDGEETPLESFGMVEVTLTTADGEPVNIKSDKLVDLVFPLARNHGFKDGDPIALWNFDEAEQHWVQLGEGIVQGDSFRATVAHFSWWNADKPLTRACIRGRVLDANGSPAGGAAVTISGRSYLGETRATTDMSGSFCAYARVSSKIELKTTFESAGKAQVVAIAVGTPRSMGTCEEPESCLMVDDLRAVADAPMCDPTQCPSDGDRVACCKTDIGPCDFVVNGDCGGKADGSWDAVPTQPGVMEIPGVPMSSTPDAGTPGGSGGSGGSVDAGVAGRGGAGGFGGSAGSAGRAGSGGAGGRAGTGGSGGSWNDLDAGVDDEDGGFWGGWGGSGGSGSNQPDVARCTEAIPVSEGSIAVDTTGSDLVNDWWEDGYCNEYLPGLERTYAIQVPANETLRARVMGSEGARVIISTDCHRLLRSCQRTGLEAEWRNSYVTQTVYVTVDHTVTDAAGAYTLILDTRSSSSPTCGDGFLGYYGEGCDDGNLISGDGCDSTCNKEQGWFCTAATGCSRKTCGDGVSQQEECDDRNTNSGDGCSASCMLERGFVCPEFGMGCRAIACGDGRIDTTTRSKVDDDQRCDTYDDAQGALDERCDDSNANTGDGCSSTCQIEAGYACSGTPSLCMQRPAGDLCSNALPLEAGSMVDFAMLQRNAQYANGPDAYFKREVAPGSVLRLRGEVSGEAYVQVYESDYCDGRDNYDYRSYRVQGPTFELSWQRDSRTEFDESAVVTMVVSSSSIGANVLALTDVRVVAPGCGDGIRQYTEACDDGNSAANDGCSATCVVENGFVCDQYSERAMCHRIVCGDAIVDSPAEACDRGPDVANDGCSDICQQDSGSLCDYSNGPPNCVTKPAHDLCNNAQLIEAGMERGSYDLVGFSSDATDPTRCYYSSCNVSRWFRVDQAPDTSTSVKIGSAGFEGWLGEVRDVCPNYEGYVYAYDFQRIQRDGLTVRNDTGRSRAVYFVLSARDATTSKVDLTFETRPIGCGDGSRDDDEQCDDGNTTAGDGCSDTCKVEGDYRWDCYDEGRPCTPRFRCGDGQRDDQAYSGGYERCDDGNVASGDGCSATCQVEDGYVCPNNSSGGQCTAVAQGAVCTEAATLASGALTLQHCGPNCDSSELHHWGQIRLQPGQSLDLTFAELVGVEYVDVEIYPVGVVADCRNLRSVARHTVLASSSNEPLHYLNSNEVRDLLLNVRARQASAVTVDLTVAAGYSTTCGDGDVNSQTEGCDDGNSDELDGCPSTCTVDPRAVCEDGRDCVVLPPANLCASSTEPLASPASLSLATYKYEEAPTCADCGATRWTRISVPARSTLSARVATTNIAQARADLYDITAPYLCSDGRSLQGYDFGTGSATRFAYVNDTQHDWTLAIRLQDLSNTGASTGSVQVTYSVKPRGCGDGYLDSSNAGIREFCDDGNTSAGDGCSPDCDVEPGYVCHDNGCNVVTCGDGKRQQDERCDDGNVAPSDGCSATCRVESGYACTGGDNERSTCAVLDRPAGDVCSNASVLQVGAVSFAGMRPDYYSGYPDVVRWVRTTPGTAVVLEGTADLDVRVQFSDRDALCSEGSGSYDSDYIERGKPFRLEVGTEYSDLPTNLAIVFSAMEQNPTGALNITRVNVGIPYCGNGIVTRSTREQCDDGNRIAGDGCSPLCHVEKGYICPPDGSCRLMACGDGHVDRHSDWCPAHELCDDGNLLEADGCSSTCLPEPGYRCVGAPSLCQVAQPGEECTSAQALLEGDYPLAGYLGAESCSYPPCGADRWLQESVPPGQVLVIRMSSNSSQGQATLYELQPHCGDIRQSDQVMVRPTRSEWLTYRNNSGAPVNVAVQLSDRDNTSGSTIAYTISRVSIAPSVCGDGYRDYNSNERCDDGNTNAGDGCSASCQEEPSFDCTGDSPTVCQSLDEDDAGVGP